MFLFSTQFLMPLIFMPPATQNVLQDECIVQLYLRPINAFLGINKRGDVISTANFSDCDSECIMLVCYCTIIVQPRRCPVAICTCE